MANGGVREAILANLKTVLQGLMTPSASYGTVVSHVTRDVKPLDQYVQKSQFPLVQIKAGNQEADTDLEIRTFDEVGYVLDVNIECALQARENVSTALNIFIEDVVEAVMLDITRGGCATDTNFVGLTEVDELMLKNDAAASFTASFQIMYSTAEGSI